MCNFLVKVRNIMFFSLHRPNGRRRVTNLEKIESTGEERKKREEQRERAICQFANAIRPLLPPLFP